MSFENWTEGLTEICSGFQADLSCLVDGELDGPAAARAMLHLEDCGGCREFFEDTRRHARLHKDVADPERLLARIAMLTGSDLARAGQRHDLVHRLATIFYQLGKAYVLAAIDPGFRERIFEEAVPVAATKSHGRGFVDGVLMGGKAADGEGPVDWRHARHMLNGRLENIVEPKEKGRRLLEEAVSVDPEHEEARLYLAFLASHEGKLLQSAEGYREVLETALDERNRAHAAIQLGRLYWDEENTRKALSLWRWVLATGIADSDERFWFVRINVAMGYVVRGRSGRAVAYLREMLDRYPGRAQDAARVLAEAPEMRGPLATDGELAEALVGQCPELFAVPDVGAGQELEG